MRSKIAYIDQSNYAPPFDFHHIEQLAKKWDVDFFCSKESLNDSYIEKVKTIAGVKVKQFEISNSLLVFRILAYLRLHIEILVRYRRYEFVYVQWYLSPLELLLALLIRKKLFFGLHNLVPHEHKAKISIPYLLMIKLAKLVACYSSHVFQNAQRLYKSPSHKFCFMQHGYITDFEKKEADEKIEYYSSAAKPGVAFIGSVKRYKGLEQILTTNNIGFFKKTNFYVHGRFVGDQIKLKKVLTEHQLTFEDSSFNESIFDTVKRDRTIIVLPYYNISQSGFMYTLAGKGIPFIASNVGDIKDFLHSISMEQAIFDPNKEHDIRRAYSFVRENYNSFAESLEISKSKYNWEIDKKTISFISNKFQIGQ